MSDNSTPTTTIPSEYIPRWIKVAAIVWPIVVGLMTATFASAQASSALDHTINRVEIIETQGSPAVRERLARIEQALINSNQTLVRVENKLDTVLTSD
jgi:hypothetical protein